MVILMVMTINIEEIKMIKHKHSAASSLQMKHDLTRSCVETNVYEGRRLALIVSARYHARCIEIQQR